jgi:hypothetical protein
MNSAAKESPKSLLKKAKLRLIDQGTAYDVPGRLKSLARAIERGEYGRVTDVGIVVKSFRHSDTHMVCKHVGTGTKGDLLMMANHFYRKAGE